jgi:hypothetical protein
MAKRTETKIALEKATSDLSTPELPNQNKRPETGQFRLQVDRQTKGAYQTPEAAEQAGLLIKQEHPIVQVSVYDSAIGTTH